MAYHMSFFITTEQIRNQTKTVTRRNGWWNLKPGTHIYACEKCQGLKKGEKVVILGQIRVASVSPTRLDKITQEDCDMEGFPHLSPSEFVALFCKTHKGVNPSSTVNRIEFEYI